MLKELWILIKLLFGQGPNEVEKVTLMGMNHFPFKGYSYLMWCGRMVYRNDALESRRKEWLTKRYKVSKNHETIHLMQAKACGSWVKYYMKYLWEWLKGNPIISPSSSAYYTCPFECEAYANESDMNYCKDYDAGNIKKYTFKNRKKMYKNAGGTSKGWKEYLNSIP